MTRPRWLLLAIAGILTLVACSSGSDGRSVAPGDRRGKGDGPAVSSRLRWHECEFGDCARLRVPVDETDPAGPQVSIAMARGSVAEPGRKIGTLFVNPGGPGASGRDFASYVASALPDAVTTRFDVVSWDPRGTGGTAPVDCGRKLDYVFAPDSAPDSAAELAELQSATKRFVDACVARTGDWLQHISTDDTVADLDAMRAAVGDAGLTYLGLSYGTFIGAKYAERFPDRVRALVLDGAVDPSLSPEDLTVSQAQGFDASLAAFLADCARRSSCAFHHDGDPRAAYEQLRAAVDTRPVGGGDQKLGPTQFDIGVGALLYSGANAYSVLADALRALEDGSTGPLLAAANLYLGRDGAGRYDPSWSSFVAISCADGPNLSVAETEALQLRAATEAPDFGAASVGLGYGCAYWPYPPKRTAPAEVHARTKVPIVVVGTTGDPATPLPWSARLADQLGNARLVVVEGSTHTSSLEGNRCLERIESAYFLDQRTPAGTSRCG